MVVLKRNEPDFNILPKSATSDHSIVLSTPPIADKLTSSAQITESPLISISNNLDTVTNIESSSVQLPSVIVTL